jgi:hypothetical protein
VRARAPLAPFLLRDALTVTEFVNADRIAQGLSAFNPEAVAIQAGRAMLSRLDELARRRETFAFETTLASRSFAPWLRVRRPEGYTSTLSFAGYLTRTKQCGTSSSASLGVATTFRQMCPPTLCSRPPQLLQALPAADDCLARLQHFPARAASATCSREWARHDGNRRPRALG